MKPRLVSLTSSAIHPFPCTPVHGSVEAAPRRRVNVSVGVPFRALRCTAPLKQPFRRISRRGRRCFPCTPVHGSVEAISELLRMDLDSGDFPCTPVHGSVEAARIGGSGSPPSTGFPCTPVHGSVEAGIDRHRRNPDRAAFRALRCTAPLKHHFLAPPMVRSPDFPCTPVHGSVEAEGVSYFAGTGLASFRALRCTAPLKRVLAGDFDLVPELSVHSGARLR